MLVNGEKSSVSSVISGIPQGTVLGPLLFIIYINDILDNINSDGLLFAFLLQDDIHKLEAWSNQWLLRFHPDKCHLLTLGKLDNIRYCHCYKVNSKEIDHVFEEKDLGVIVDSDLSFAEHIMDKVKKANGLVGSTLT